MLGKESLRKTYLYTVRSTYIPGRQGIDIFEHVS